MATNWSNYQTNIFNFIDKADGSAVIEAVAGSGKTTTIVAAIKHCRGNNIFLAFNKSIADELKARGVNARTFHSLTYGATLRARNAHSVDTNKTFSLLDQVLATMWHNGEIKDTGAAKQMYRAFVAKLVGLGKQVGIGALVKDTHGAWESIIDYHDLELEEGSYTTAISLASQVLELGSTSSNLVDFDDMLYLPVRMGLSLPKFDFVFVDEAQDTNAIQRALLKKILHSKSRLIAVGDPAQAIYGFRGADSNSLDLIKEEFSCTTLPLSVTYRCPASVVKYARQWVNHIEAREGAPEGDVVNLGQEWNTAAFKPEDLIVCRTTRPLITMAYKLLRDRIPATVRGNDIGAGIKTLIKKMGAMEIDHLETSLDLWAERESEKARAKGNDAKVERIYDQRDTVMFLVDQLTEGNRSISALLSMIDELFSNKANAIQLSTIHKAKGLEADTVFWLNRSQCPARWAKREWQQQQEINLCYVATTRARNTLILIEEKTGSEE